jgi:hypothetical protein
MFAASSELLVSFSPKRCWNEGRMREPPMNAPSYPCKAAPIAAEIASRYIFQLYTACGAGCSELSVALKRDFMMDAQCNLCGVNIRPGIQETRKLRLSWNQEQQPWRYKCSSALLMIGRGLQMYVRTHQGMLAHEDSAVLLVTAMPHGVVADVKRDIILERG